MIGDGFRDFSIGSMDFGLPNSAQRCAHPSTWTTTNAFKYFRSPQLDNEGSQMENWTEEQLIVPPVSENE